MLDFQGLCRYIPQGPDTTTIEDIQFWSLWMSTPDVDNVGSSGSANYSPEISANANNLRLTSKIGPAIEIYDPEWAAWLAGEI